MTNNINLNDVAIRTVLRSGDIGYVTRMHGVLYKEEYDFGIIFEAYVASGLCEFYKNYNPERDCVWVAEHKDRMVGFLLLMHRGNDIAQLRYFILDPAYRGIGLGKKLVGLYMDCLKERNYKTCYLWTTNEQATAINIYKKLGFVFTEEVDSTAFGKPLKEQRYDLLLR